MIKEPAASPSVALDRALEVLRRTQRTDHWAGELSSSALATAMSISALHVTDPVAHRPAIDRGRGWLFATQNANSGWGDAVIDQPNVNATALSVSALVLTSREAGSRAEEAALERALRCLEQHFGGFAVVGDPARCTLSGPCRTLAAMAGLMDWRTIKRLRPEIVLIPTRFRRMISTTFPAYLSIATLHSTRAPHVLNTLPTYRLALRQAMDWLARAQGPNGSFEESAFLTSVIVMCLVAAGFEDLPWLIPAVEFIVDSQRPDGGWPIDRDLELFDTDLTVFAFREADSDVPAAEHVSNWLLRQQVSETCFATGAPPGGWAWAQPSGWPDADDTAYTLLALAALQVPVASAALQKGAEWLAWMQHGSGSWSTFVRGSNMPFDHDCPYVTGHAVSALQSVGYFARNPDRLDRALAYLHRIQRVDGSFPSIWFREVTAGTASVLQALCDVGLRASQIAVRARNALLSNQNGDGGWGGVHGEVSTAEETAWAVLALLACNESEVASVVQLGVDWLLAHQLPDGTWRPSPIGLYYSAMWYSDSMYALAWPAQALARAAQHRTG